MVAVIVRITLQSFCFHKSHVIEGQCKACPGLQVIVRVSESMPQFESHFQDGTKIALESYLLGWLEICPCF